ncbi:MAG: hypothetical protein GF313_02675 [Caldithrix sp.]|nr:hypothetical protein [Caldithrix sp.]
MAGSLWDSFDHLLDEAETAFLAFDIITALEKWREYYRITAIKEYKRYIDEIEALWDETKFRNPTSCAYLFEVFLELREQFRKNMISVFSYKMYLRLIQTIYKNQFKHQANENTMLARGVFEYLNGDYNQSIEKLKMVLKEQQRDSLLARVYLSFCHFKKDETKTAVIWLTQSLFLDAGQLKDDDLYLTQFKLLYSQLNSKYENPSVAAWMLTFEAWYRNWLLIEEDEPFFALMQKKESDERIMQVKYYAFERYRHFVRCLFIAEYARKFHKNKQGLIHEQEQYMERLDQRVFARYRKKRKPII